MLYKYKFSAYLVDWFYFVIDNIEFRDVKLILNV